jgi:hypothetical protein
LGSAIPAARYRSRISARQHRRDRRFRGHRVHGRMVHRTAARAPPQTAGRVVTSLARPRLPRARRLSRPVDNFIEAHTHFEGPDNNKVMSAIRNEVEAIVSKFGGMCYEGGPTERDQVPFADLFEPAVRVSKKALAFVVD